MKRKILEPVAPSAMDIILTYVCPSCHASITSIAPLQPALVTCPHCKQEYPIVPADPYTIQYIRLILANGSAIMNPDFV